MLKESPEPPVVVGSPVSKQVAMIWLVIKSEVVAAIWRLRNRLMLASREQADEGSVSGSDAGVGGVAVLAHSGEDVLREWQVALRARVMEERFRPTPGLQMTDWLANAALAEEDIQSASVLFSELLGWVRRRILESEDRDAPDHLYVGLSLSP